MTTSNSFTNWARAPLRPVATMHAGNDRKLVHSLSASISSSMLTPVARWRAVKPPALLISSTSSAAPIFSDSFISLILFFVSFMRSLVPLQYNLLHLHRLKSPRKLNRHAELRLALGNYVKHHIADLHLVTLPDIHIYPGALALWSPCNPCNP